MFRRGHVWTADKLEFLENYIPAFKKATLKAISTHYVDGFAGPGINHIEGKKQKGSPLIALDTNPSFTKYFFVEQDKLAYLALENIVKSHQNADSVSLFNNDFNIVANQILSKIPDLSPTLFFLDPEGLELEWKTVELISHRTKADLFILISSSGVNRNVHDLAMHDRISRFYGTEEWKEVLKRFDDRDYPVGTTRFEVFTNLYVERLNKLGFTNSREFLIARNDKNVPLHALVFAVKSNKGEAPALKIAESVLKNLKSGNQGSLF